MEFERHVHEPGMGGLKKLSCIMGKEVPSVWAAWPILLTVTQDIWGAAASILTMFFKYLSLLSTQIFWKWNTKLLEYLFKILKSNYLVDVYFLMNESHNKFQITGQFFKPASGLFYALLIINKLLSVCNIICFVLVV